MQLDFPGFTFDWIYLSKAHFSGKHLRSLDNEASCRLAFFDETWMFSLLYINPSDFLCLAPQENSGTQLRVLKVWTRTAWDVLIFPSCFPLLLPAPLTLFSSIQSSKTHPLVTVWMFCRSWRKETLANPHEACHISYTSKHHIRVSHTT